MAVNWMKVPLQKPSGLRHLIHEHLAGNRPGRDLKNVHASDLTYNEKERPFCPRERALQWRDKDKAPPEFISTSLAMTFDIGRFVEGRVAEIFAEKGMAVGDWDCLHCSRRHKFQKHPVQCAQCGHRRFKYVEVRITAPDNAYSCGIDLLLDLPGHTLLEAVEIKSIDKDEFKKLVAPLAEHGQRTRLYLRCLNETADPHANLIRKDRGTIIYVSKGGFGVACPEVKLWDFHDDAFSPIKDWPIERDDQAVQHYVDKAQALVEYRKNGTMPNRICQSSLDKRATKCPKQVQCWAKAQ